MFINYYLVRKPSQHSKNNKNAFTLVNIYSLFHEFIYILWVHVILLGESLISW